MDTIADSQLMEEASPDEGEDDWLVPEDASDLHAASVATDLTGPRPRNCWPAALTASVFFHVLLIVAAFAIFSHVQSTFHWRIERGDPSGQNGLSIRGQPNDSTSTDEPSISAPPIPAESLIHQPAEADASEEATELPDRLLPPPPYSDPVIGVALPRTTEAIPHFAAKKAPVQRASGTVGYSLSKSPAPGESIPPRVAGPRGQRDGFDSRGLPIPDYPAESRRRGEEGVVVVDVEVLPDGSVGVIRVVSDAGHPRLAASAVEKLKTATFEPAQQDGKRVVGHVLIPYRFTLE